MIGFLVVVCSFFRIGRVVVVISSIWKNVSLNMMFNLVGWKM